MNFAVKANLKDVVCDDPATFEPFDATSYMGLWYEIEHVANQPFQPDSWTCTTA